MIEDATTLEPAAGPARPEAPARAPGPRGSAGYIPILDGLRAVSIGLVLVGHLLHRERPSVFVDDLGFELGSIGVSVFFVVSGYLITMLLLREERRDGSISLKGFYTRRALRIFPAFYAYFAVFTALAVLGFIPGVPLHDFPATALYLRNLTGRSSETSHIWSLSLEEQFYLIWPTLMIVVASRRRLGLLAVAMAAFAAWRTFLVLTGRTNWWYLYIRPDQRMDTILVGCGLALLAEGERFERLSRSVLERGWFAAVVALALVAWAAASPVIPYAGIFQLTTTAALITLLVHWMIRRAGSPALAWLQTPAMLFVGRLSYSLYLWQQLFLADRTPQMDAVRRFPLDMILIFACALISYYGVERPFLALKDRGRR